MKKIIIFDTNFLIANKGKVKDIVNKIEESDYLVYIPQISKEEFINIQLRNIKQDYKQLEQWNSNKAYLNLQFAKEQDVLTSFEKRYNKSFKEYFGDKIIPYNEKNLLGKILERNKYKEPPFYNEQGSSDKGFKDTILWLSLKNFIVNYAEVTSFYFITSDNGFIKYQEKLEEEIKEKDFKIVDANDVDKLFEVLEIENKKEDNIFQKAILEPLDIASIREKINNIMESILYYNSEDWYGESYSQKRFTIYKYISYEETEKFLKNIPQVLTENVFRKTINLESFFEFNTYLYSDVAPIDIEIMTELSTIYISIKDSSYKEPFIKFVMQKINENKESTPFDKNDDLPF